MAEELHIKSYWKLADATCESGVGQFFVGGNKKNIFLAVLGGCVADTVATGRLSLGPCKGAQSGK